MLNLIEVHVRDMQLNGVGCCQGVKESTVRAPKFPGAACISWLKTQ